MARRMVMRFLALLLAAVLLVACNPFGLRDLLDAATRAPLVIDPTDVSVPAGATLTFTGRGGVPGYTYSASIGSIGPSGTYTAPLSAGTAVITVTDAAGATASTSVTITELATGLSLSPSSITVTVNSEVQFEAVGGTGPYSYAITVEGSGAPDINAATAYYVAGGAPGTDIVTVTDFLGATATATVTVVALSSAVNYDITSTAGLPPSAMAGEPIAGSPFFTVTNVGPGDGASTVEWKVHLSADGVLDGGDVVVKSGTTGALASNTPVNVALTGAWPAGPAGSGFLIVTVEAADDTSPADNSASAAFTLEPRDVDYRVPSVIHLDGTYAGEQVDVRFTIENQGTAAGSSTIYWFVYASSDAAVDGSDYLLKSGSRGPLGAGPVTSPAIDVISTWPTTPNPYYLLVRVCASDDVDPANDTGGTATPVAVTGAPPANIDYQAAAPTCSSTVAGGSANGSFNVTNTGTVAGSQNVYWTVYRSSDATLEIGTDAVLAMGSRTGFAPPAPVPVAYSGTWPAGAATWYLFAVVSAGDDVDPLDNESAGTPVAVTAPNVDYVIQAFTETSGVVAGDPIDGLLTVRNAGTAGGTRPVAWTVYLSQDATLDPLTDLVAGAGALPVPLGAGDASGSIDFGGSWPFTPYPPWTWRLYLVVAAEDENDPSDNISAPLVRTTIAPSADYDVVSVSGVGGTAGSPLTASFDLTNLGPHAGTQAVPWRAYVSTNNVYDAGVDELIDSGIVASPGLAFPTIPIPVSFSGIWPATAGTWYLVVVLDAGDDPISANDWGASGPLVTVAPDVNYDVLTVENDDPPAPVAGGQLAARFSVRNTGTADGSQTVFWIAYRSDDASLTAGIDPVIASGSLTELPHATTLSDITFTNVWPTSLVTKNYYLFVTVSAADDINAGDDTGMSAMVTVDPPNVDYDVISVSNTGLLVAGGDLDGTFEVRNVGSANGSKTLYWSVYRSLDMIYTEGVDPIIQTGSIIGGLPSSTSAYPTFTGTWPEDTVSRTYYYYVKIVAADDINAANDDLCSASGLVVNPPAAVPDYRVFNPIYQSTGIPGSPLAGAHSFQIQNANPSAGTKPVAWRVYASYDAILDGGDTLLEANSIGALDASDTSLPITFGGTWPASGSWYHLIVSLDADDDANPSNDGWASGAVEVVKVDYVEGAENNSSVGPTTVPLPNVSATALVMNENRYVQINGTMDAKFGIDTYRLQLGADATRLNIRLEWATGSNACDLYLWDEANAQGVENTATADREEVTFINLNPGAVYYVGVYFPTNDGALYQLYLYAEPD